MHEPTNSPTGWVAKHIRDYVDSEGRKGHRWNGQNTLLLTTTGRRSGTARRTALIYGEDSGNYIVVGSYGGKDSHPYWYLNLRANPDVIVQVGPEVFTARARTASAGEKPALWKLMVSLFPTYESYQKRTMRDIPVVILEPQAL